MVGFERLHGRHKILLAVFTVIVLLVVYFISYVHHTSIKASKIAVLNRLKAISCTASLQINGDHLSQLKSTFLRKDDISSNDQSPLYLQLHRQLQEIWTVNGLKSPVYAMTYNEEAGKFEFLVTSANDPYYRHDYEQFPLKLKEDYQIGGMLDVYEDENGSWLSAYAPIKDSKGSVVALLQVDESFEDFIESAQNALVKNILLALTILIPFSLLLYSFIDRTLKVEEESKKYLEEKNEEIRIQGELIQVNNEKLEEAKRIIEARNKSLDKQVKKRTQELLKANRDLETFLYRSSHDVQGPLATLKGLCTLAQYDVDSPSTEALVNKINRTTYQLSNRVRNINAVYLIKSKKLDKETFEFAEVLDEVKRGFKREINAHGIVLKTEIVQEIILHTDKEILTLAIGELLKNAIEHGATHPHPEVIITAAKQRDSFAFSVVDNGGNIDPAVRNRIFKMFERGSYRSAGAGLGLYVVRLALRKLNGNIHLRLNPPGITQFDVSLSKV